MTVEEIEKLCEGLNNPIIFQNMLKANMIINKSEYKVILCSISGGSDSDIMLDICHKVDKDKKIKYVWFDTGLEYEATKRHLNYLEEKYGIKIIRERAIKPIPLTVHQEGQPFLSKYVSEQIQRLQIHGFGFEDGTYEELIEKYPNVPKSSISWWTNHYTEKHGFDKVSRFNIRYNKWLKEFMLENPINFKVTNKCCKYAKKDVGKHLVKKYKADMQIIGVRQAEGGIRATMYKSCFSDNKNNGGDCDYYRPVFFYRDEDKIDYERFFDIKHSDCYTKYGLKRTGCAGCPFGREYLTELGVINEYEPKLFKAVNNMFKESYEYTRAYHEFYQKKEKELKKTKEFEKNGYYQTDIYDILSV